MNSCTIHTEHSTHLASSMYLMRVLSITLLNSFSLPAGRSPPSLGVDTGGSSVILVWFTADESMLVSMLSFVSVFSISSAWKTLSSAVFLSRSARHFYYGTPPRPKSARRVEDALRAHCSSLLRRRIWTWGAGLPDWAIFPAQSGNTSRVTSVFSCLSIQPARHCPRLQAWH